MESLFPLPDEGRDPRRASREAMRVAWPSRSGHHDELFGGRRQPGHEFTPEWTRFFDLLGRRGLGALDHAKDAVQRQIRENGISYNVYADADGSSRPWALDLLPWIITPTEWASIEAGAIQRAVLLEAMLADVYGPHRLLDDGLLPAALTLGSPGYVRAMQGVKPAGGHLHIAAFDMARGPDGKFWVVSQRLQAPSGLGYLLENRLTISSQFPAAFRDLRVQRLASSYRALVDSIAQSNPLAGSRTVLLTPGPFNETYFEQSYLARYLGIPLVEGGDLAVRGDRVHLKTIHGLEPVGAVLRRIDDDFCDPLELRSDSALGVPGLMQAVRAGNVLLANAIGAGWLDSPAVNGFLPGISEALLGEKLKLHSLPSWWCGEEAVLPSALSGLGRRVIKPTESLGMEPVIGADLGEAQVDEWKRRIHAQPEAYTLQDFLPLSQLPTWQGGALLPRAAMLRVFVVRRPSDKAGQPASQWTVVPGGLARLAHSDRQVVSMQRGGSSADVWVMTDAPIDEFSLLPSRIGQEELRSRHRTVSSRAAENLFWLGRYAERSDYVVRLARLVLAGLGEDESLPDALLEAITELCVDVGLVPEETPTAAQSRILFERSLVDGFTAPKREAGIRHNLGALERAATQVRDRLSPDHWRLIVAAHADFLSTRDPAAAGPRPATSDTLRTLQQLSDHLAAITNAQFDRMTRDDGWRLLALGRQIERAATLANAMQILVKPGVLAHAAGFDLLLGLFDSTLTYRALYQRRLELPAVIDLLALDAANPRALSTVVAYMRAQWRRLPNDDGQAPEWLPDPADWDADALCANTPDALERITELAQSVQSAAYAMSDAISLRYFSHSQAWKSR
ncbi:circularly permuted type 2 ATP-grasp protein [soil metagenome]